MKEFLEGWKDEIFVVFIFLSALFIILLFITYSIGPKVDLLNKIDYKDKIIEREYGRNFESYEDYLVYRIEKGL